MPSAALGDFATGPFDCRFERVERAGADIAIDHAEGA
jgi:hypothetical protein